MENMKFIGIGVWLNFIRNTENINMRSEWMFFSTGFLRNQTQSRKVSSVFFPTYNTCELKDDTTAQFLGM